MRSALILLALMVSGGCSDPTESGPATPAVETALDQLSRTVKLGPEDLMLPSRCNSLQAPILITFGDFESSAQPWLITSPEQLGVREKEDPSMRDPSGRADGLLVHRSGGYLSNPDFTIQCRSTELMGLDGPNHFVRCRLADPGLTKVVGFDVPTANADCAGFIAREVQRRVPDFHTSRRVD